MSKLICVSGPSGIGKSTLAKKLQNEFFDQNRQCVIFSTDQYWLTPTGEYNFNPRLLEDAHNWNFAKFKDYINDIDFNKLDVVAIIDNTNLRFSEFSRYVELALHSKWDIEISRFYCQLTDEELFHRNVHKVPLEVIHRQRERWQSKEDMQNQLERLKEQIYGATKV